jgi:hypothetical protein
MGFADFRKLFTTHGSESGKQFCSHPVFSYSFRTKNQQDASEHCHIVLEFFNGKGIPLKYCEEPEQMFHKGISLLDFVDDDGYNDFRTFFGLDVYTDDVLSRDIYLVERICRSIEHYARSTVIGDLELIEDTLNDDEYTVVT